MLRISSRITSLNWDFARSQDYSPLFEKEGLGEIFNKSPSIPLFHRGKLFIARS
jgi:hypothetical protein